MPNSDGMQCCGDPGRHQRVCPVQDEELDEPRRNLCRPNQRCGGDGLERCRAGALEQARQVRRHGASDEPGGREYESEQEHFPVWLPPDRRGMCQLRVSQPRDRR